MERLTEKAIVYLDASVLNRPFDDQSQVRISLETSSFTKILNSINLGELIFVTSWVLLYENSKNPHLQRQKWIFNYCKLAQEICEVNESIVERANALESRNISAIDALHVACAEYLKASVLITCDDKLIARYNEVKDKKLQIMSPVTFVMRVEDERNV